jgi:3-dehydrotetronate 4-kinase
MISPLLGCIADDFTGASDLASNLVEAGMRVVQCLGIPQSLNAIADADAIVIALKTRSIDRNEAVQKSLEALSTLQSIGTTRFYFKYCSTFDSTDDGNIGPVAEALMQSLDIPQAILCPAFPENGRTLYCGHLFVGNDPLNESGMEHHPLTPMTDFNLIRVLSRQTQMQVGSIPYALVEKGAESINDALRILHDNGKRMILVDTLNNTHLKSIAMACADMPLITGSSGVAIGLPDAYRMRGLLSNRPTIPQMPTIRGRTAIIAGSCSLATQGQVAHMRLRCPSRKIDVRKCVAEPESEVADLVDWAKENASERSILIAATSNVMEVVAVQSEFGKELVARCVESVLAAIAQRLVAECGVRRLIVAGGETAGAVVSSLGVRTLRIGPRIAAGVPWTESLDGPSLAISLKSGNFGGVDFFQRAVEMLSK